VSLKVAPNVVSLKVAPNVVSDRVSNVVSLPP
jgi:hypothetical protein